MASSILEAFVKLFADDTELRKTFGALPGVALKAGADVGQSFTAGVGRGVTPSRASSAVPLQLQRVGGQEVNAAGSPFSQGFQQFKTARELAEIQRTGADAFTKSGEGARKATKDVDDYELSVRDAAGSVRLLGVSVLSELNPAVGALGSVALDAARNLKGLGVGIAAGGAAAAAAALLIGLYIAKVKEGITAQVELANAVRRGDFESLDAQARKAADAIGTFEKQAQLANQSISSLQGVSEVIVSFWANQFGPAAETLADRLKRTREAAAGVFFQGGGSEKLQQKAIAETQQLIQQRIGLDRDAAASSAEVRVATDRLIDSKRRETEAIAKGIEAEIKDIERRRDVLKELDPKLAETQIDEVNRRAKAARDKGLIDEEQARRQGDRAGAEFDAKQREREGADLAFRRRHITAVLGLAQQIVDSEGSANVSLEQVFRARGDIQRAATQSQLASLKEESDSRRAALQERIQGAQGSERADLERELTQVTQEETAKRTEILTQSIAQSIQLAQKERQERISQAEQVFSIQRSLNQRRLQDDITTQAAIALNAQTGSQTQIAALQKVAEMTAQIQTQARSAITAGINLLQQQSQRLGLEGPAFVSLRSIQRGADQQKARDERTRQNLLAGRSVRTEDALAAEQLNPFEQFGNNVTEAAKKAFTPIADQFKTLVGEGITNELTTLTTKVSESFTGIVTAATPALESLEKLFSETWERMVKRAEEGTSQLGQSITKMVEDNLTRSLRDAERRF